MERNLLCVEVFKFTTLKHAFYFADGLVEQGFDVVHDDLLRQAEVVSLVVLLAVTNAAVYKSLSKSLLAISVTRYQYTKHRAEIVADLCKGRPRTLATPRLGRTGSTS